VSVLFSTKNELTPIRHLTPIPPFRRLCLTPTQFAPPLINMALVPKRRHPRHSGLADYKSENSSPAKTEQKQKCTCGLERGQWDAIVAGLQR
jgi:hypothetical protein